jgi:hypothetical protein
METKATHFAWRVPVDITQDTPGTRPICSTRAPPRGPRALRPCTAAFAIPASASDDSARVSGTSASSGSASPPGPRNSPRQDQTRQATGDYSLNREFRHPSRPAADGRVARVSIRSRSAQLRFSSTGGAGRRDTPPHAAVGGTQGVGTRLFTVRPREVDQWPLALRVLSAFICRHGTTAGCHGRTGPGNRRFS